MTGPRVIDSGFGQIGENLASILTSGQQIANPQYAEIEKLSRGVLSNPELAQQLADLQYSGTPLPPLNATASRYLQRFQPSEQALVAKKRRGLIENYTPDPETAANVGESAILGGPAYSATVRADQRRLDREARDKLASEARRIAWANLDLRAASARGLADYRTLSLNQKDRIANMFAGLRARALNDVNPNQRRAAALRAMQEIGSSDTDLFMRAYGVGDRELNQEETEELNGLQAGRAMQKVNAELKGITDQIRNVQTAMAGRNIDSDERRRLENVMSSALARVPAAYTAAGLIPPSGNWRVTQTTGIMGMGGEPAITNAAPGREGAEGSVTIKLDDVGNLDMATVLGLGPAPQLRYPLGGDNPPAPAPAPARGGGRGAATSTRSAAEVATVKTNFRNTLAPSDTAANRAALRAENFSPTQINDILSTAIKR